MSWPSSVYLLDLRYPQTHIVAQGEQWRREHPLPLDVEFSRFWQTMEGGFGTGDAPNDIKLIIIIIKQHLDDEQIDQRPRCSTH